MTITWANNVPNPVGQTGDENKVLVVSGADGVSSVSVASLPHPNDGSMVFSIWWKAASATTATVTALGASKVGNIGTDWSRFYVAIPTPTGSNIDIVPANGSSDIYMAMAQLEMGEVPSDWRGVPTETALNIVSGKVETVVETVDSVVRETATPGQYQVYVGGSSGNSLVALDNSNATILQITKNGFIVNSGNATVMQISPESFTVINNAATDPDDQTTMEITPTSFKVNTELVEFNVPNESLRIDGDGASLDYLTVNKQLIAPGVNGVYDGPTSITVGTGGMYLTLSEVAAMLNNKFVADSITINIVSDITDYCTFSGVHGGGSILIMSNGGSNYKLLGEFRFQGCGIPIFIFGVDIALGDSGYYITVNACRYVAFSSVNMQGRGSGLLSIQNGSTVMLNSCGLYAASTLINCDGSTLACNSLVGAPSIPASQYFLTASASSIMWHGTRPSGSYFHPSSLIPCLIACDSSSGQLNDLTPNSGSSPSGEPSTGEVTITASTTGTYEVENGTWNGATSTDANRGNHLYQGRWEETLSVGCMWFDMSTIPNGATITGAKLKFHRYSGAGGASPVIVNLSTTTLTGKSGNPVSSRVDRGELVPEIGNDETLTVTTAGLVQAVQAIKAGTAAGLMFYINDDPSTKRKFSSNYARFDGVNDSIVPTLTITYET